MELVADCQQCSDPFDYQRDACPNCGWSPAEWADGGRYGLGRPGLGGRD